MGDQAKACTALRQTDTLTFIASRIEQADYQQD